MTNLEIVLLGVIWVAYGYFAAFQTKGKENKPDEGFVYYMGYIILSPLIMAVKAVYGILKEYEL